MICHIILYNKYSTTTGVCSLLYLRKTTCGTKIPQTSETNLTSSWNQKFSPLNMINSRQQTKKGAFSKRSFIFKNGSDKGKKNRKSCKIKWSFCQFFNFSLLFSPSIELQISKLFRQHLNVRCQSFPSTPETSTNRFYRSLEMLKVLLPTFHWAHRHDSNVLLNVNVCIPLTVVITFCRQSRGNKCFSALSSFNMAWTL